MPTVSRTRTSVTFTFLTVYPSPHFAFAIAIALVCVYPSPFFRRPYPGTRRSPLPRFLRCSEPLSKKQQRPIKAARPSRLVLVPRVSCRREVSPFASSVVGLPCICLPAQRTESHIILSYFLGGGGRKLLFVVPSARMSNKSSHVYLVRPTRPPRCFFNNNNNCSQIQKLTRCVFCCYRSTIPGGGTIAFTGSRLSIVLPLFCSSPSRTP